MENKVNLCARKQRKLAKRFTLCSVEMFVESISLCRPSGSHKEQIKQQVGIEQQIVPLSASLSILSVS